MWAEYVAQMDKIRNKYWALLENFFEQSLGRKPGKLLVSFSKTSELNELKPPLLLPQH
jgi:hypothetical protein